MLVGNRTHRRGHRKTLFRAEMMTEGYKLGALGLSDTEIADFWNISWRSLKRWMQHKPEFQMQVLKGKAEADLTVIQALLEQCRQGNVTAAIFWLKNRQRAKWKDRHEIDGMPDTVVQVFPNKTFVFRDIKDDDNAGAGSICGTEGAESNRCADKI